MCTPKIADTVIFTIRVMFFFHIFERRTAKLGQVTEGMGAVDFLL